MLLIQIAVTAVIVHVLASRQFSEIAHKIADVTMRVRLLGDRSAIADLPAKPLALFVATLKTASFWVAVVAGLAGVWSLS